MNNKIHLFLATASAIHGNEFDYPQGERHAMLVFINQEKNADHDWGKAQSIVEEAKWNKVEFTQAGTICAENLHGEEQAFVECYEKAVSTGSAILVYSNIET